MVGLTFIHLLLLHVDGSTNPLGINHYDYIPFYPYFLIKDIFGFLIFLLLFSYLVFFDPNLLGHPDNYIRANSMVTPPHIVPEWYFLPFYAILRAVPSKVGGVVVMGAAIGILFFLPLLDTRIHFPQGSFIFVEEKSIQTVDVMSGPVFSHAFKFFFSFWVFTFLFLGVLGGKPVEYPYSELSLLASTYYFVFFFLYF
jgi:quinol-cytochrome oxidoreductase complex cytochrome b subunit